MSDDARTPPAEEKEDYFPTLNYARPSRRKSDSVANWKAFCRVVGGTMVVTAFFGYVGQFLFASPPLLIAVIGIVFVGSLAFLFHREVSARAADLSDAKSRRAATWRASASRFDSAPVTDVDPHSIKS